MTNASSHLLEPISATAGISGNGFIVTAPGRVNLIGEHTDYNDGLVLPMAIERGIRIEVRPREDRLVVLSTDRESGSLTLDLEKPLEPGAKDWSCYPAGVLAGFERRGWKVPGFEAKISADLPAGGGLSSSAALEVGMATVIEVLCGKSLLLEEKALLCQTAEHEFAGVPCGIMDQFAVTFGRAGHALLLDCQSRAMSYVPMGSCQVLIIHSGVKHSLVDGEYAQRREQCQMAAQALGVQSLREVSLETWSVRSVELLEPLRSRAQHVITEHQRTLDFVAALKIEDWSRAGMAMYESHQSLSADYEVSCRELDLLVDLSQTISGVHGCRMTGGGFGGCVVALIEIGSEVSVMQEFRQRYFSATGIDPMMFVSQAADGPRVKPMN